MSPFMIAVAAGAVFTLVGSTAGYFKGRSDGAAIEAGKQAKAEIMVRQARDEALRVSADAIAKIAVQNTTYRQRVEATVHEKIVYRECVHDPDSLRALNSAITGSDQPASGGKLPAADTPN